MKKEQKDSVESTDDVRFEVDELKEELDDVAGGTACEASCTDVQTGCGGGCGTCES